MPTLAVIGCGKVGRTLAYLWNQTGTFEIQRLLNLSQASAQSAAKFIGAGIPISDYGALQPADVVLLGVPDDHLAACCEMLASTGVLRSGVTVFHCSGSLSSSLLAPARECGAHCASVHPVKSFADPLRAIETFAGTYCGMEGDTEATALLQPAFEAIGGRVFRLDPGSKLIYHAATVFACNYLVALEEVALRCLEHAKLAPETAKALLEPLATETLRNVFELGTTRALTGPIARGDAQTVARQYAALTEWDVEIARAYQILGRMALPIASAQGNARSESLEAIRVILTEGTYSQRDVVFPEPQVYIFDKEMS